MPAHYDRAFDGVRDAEVLSRVFYQVGMALVRDQSGCARFMSAEELSTRRSFFCPVEVGVNPSSGGNYTP